MALCAPLVCLLAFNTLWPIEAFEREINLGPLFYVGGFLSLGAVAAETGLDDIFDNETMKLINFELGHHMWNFFSPVILFTAINPATTVPGFPAVTTSLSANIATVTGFPLETFSITHVIADCNVIFSYELLPMVVELQLGGASTSKGMRLTAPFSPLSILILMPAN